MTYPTGIEQYIALTSRVARRERLRRVFFDALGIVFIVAVLTGDWWMR